MWIASSLGFFSIVIDNTTRGRRQKWLVRARREQDLENLLSSVPALAGLQVMPSPLADYCARIRVGKRQLMAITRKLTRTIDYHNFKASIHANPDQQDKSRAYASCWHAMYDYQNPRTIYPRESRWSPRDSLDRYHAELSFDELDAMAETETRSDLRIV